MAQEAQYPELLTMTDDELFVEGAYMYKGEMPHEEISHVFLKCVIKKVDRNKLSKELQHSYGVNRVNPVYIERDIYERV